MREVVYQGAIVGRPGNYGILFPDFLGCISAGDTLDEVRVKGHEALQFHIEGMVEFGDPIPDPKIHTLPEVAADFFDPDDPDPDNWVELTPVRVLIADQAGTIPLRVRADLVQRIADLAESTHSRIDSRRFIEEAVEHEIERYRKSAA